MTNLTSSVPHDAWEFREYVVAGGLGLAGIITCSCCLTAYCLSRRNRSYGEVFIALLGKRTKFHIEKRPHGGQTKEHVIWHLDEVKLQELFPHDSDTDVIRDLDADIDFNLASLCASADVEAGFPKIEDWEDWEDECSASQSSESGALTPRTKRGYFLQNLEEVDRSTVFPLYQDGSEVEYYSCSNDVWVIAVVAVTAMVENMSGKQRVVRIVYNVVLGRTQQHRLDVEPHLLRRPLAVGELVEVRTRAADCWRSAIITSVRWNRVGRVFSVMLKVGDRPLGREVTVPGTALRRQFPGNSSVQFYAGPDVGWKRGVLRSASLSDNIASSSTSVPYSVKVEQTTTGYSFPRLARLLHHEETHEIVAPDPRCFCIESDGEMLTVAAHLVEPGDDLHRRFPL